MGKKIEKFEDFIAWQKARKLTRAIYKATTLERFARDFGLKDQIRRSAVSIMSNIAEGFERGRPSEVPSVSFNRKRLVRRVAVSTLRRARRWLHSLGPFSTTDDRGDRNSSSTWRSAPLGRTKEKLDLNTNM